MKLTISQLKDLQKRLEEANSTEVEIVEAANGKLQYYTVETKVVRRPLRRKNGKQQS